MFHFICKRVPHLRVSLEIVEKRVFFCSLSSSQPPSPVSPSNPSDQRLKSCGFAREQAISASEPLGSQTPKVTPESMMAFLKKHGFTQTQVARLITTYPRILIYDPEINFLPKFEFFSSIGFSGTDLAKHITAFPRILTKSLEDHILPRYRFLRNLLWSDEKTIAAIKRSPFLFSLDPEATIAPNIETLRRVGVPESKILFAVSQRPGDFLLSSHTFAKIVEDVMKMGFDPSQIRFMWAIHAFKSMSKSTWEKKIEVYKKWGWSEDEILVAFGKHPWCMTVSKDKITRHMEFFINEMGGKASDIANQPLFMCYSLEKRIIPRCFVYTYLKEKGLIKKASFQSWVTYTESKFLDRVVKRYGNEAPQLLKLYQEKLDLAK